MAALDLIVHGPPGSAPPVLADAFRAGLAEAGLPDVRLVPMGDDPGVDAMHALVARPGDAAVASTCTPVFIQAPLLRAMPLTHRALTPLARLVIDRFFLVVRADGPADAAAFLSRIRAAPSRSGGYFYGGINHLLALAIASGSGAEVEFVKTPSEPAVWDSLLAGELDWGVGVAAEILPHVEAGTLRPIAALHSHRLAPFAELPTLGEAGVPVEFTMWRGLMGPPGLAAADAGRWHDMAAAVVATQAWQGYLLRNGQTDGFLPGAPFAEFLDREWDWYRHHLGLAGLLPASSPSEGPTS